MTEPLHSTSPADAARLFALIPCAGSGSRAGTAQPKQYQVIAGQPMVLHTLAAFSGVARLTGCLVVVAPSDSVLNVDDQRTVVVPCGGATRAESVLNGLEHLLAHGVRAQDWVLVHDAARCLLQPAWVDRLIDACQDDEVGGLLALRQSVEVEIHHRGEVQGEKLGDQQTADHGNAERLADFGARADSQGNR